MRRTLENRLTFHGHAAFELTTSSGHTLWFDPFIDGNPVADIKASDIKKADYILLSHGHGDHLGSTFEIAKNTNATVLAAYELAGFCKSKGVKNTHGMACG